MHCLLTPYFFAFSKLIILFSRRSKETGENIISCHALENAPASPKALSELDSESFKMRHEHLLVQLVHKLC